MTFAEDSVMRTLLPALFAVLTIPTAWAQVASPEPSRQDAVQVTGCLRLWDPSIGALPGQATGPRYMLLDARQEDNPGKNVIVLPRYVVIADPSVNLAGHIDQTVRVWGHVNGSPTTPTVTPSGPDNDSASLPLTATSVTTIRGSCVPPR
jgi:hypothetical protein